jgi:hypothetical protein
VLDLFRKLLHCRGRASHCSRLGPQKHLDLKVISSFTTDICDWIDLTESLQEKLFVLVRVTLDFTFLYLLDHLFMLNGLYDESASVSFYDHEFKHVTFLI